MATDLGQLLEPQVISGLMQRVPLQEMIGEKLGLFPITESEDTVMKWDVIEGGYPTAPLVDRDSATPIIAPPGMYEMTAQPAFIRAKMPIKYSDKIRLRRPGTLNTQWGRAFVATRVARLSNAVDTTMEVFRWQAMKGKLIYTSPFSPKIKTNVDYQFKATHIVDLTLGPAARLWTALATADPFDDLIEWQDIMATDGGGTMTHMAMNLKTARLMFNNSKIISMLSVSFGGTNSGSVQGKVNAYLAEMGLQLVINRDSYEEGGTTKKMIADYDVFLFNLRPDFGEWRTVPNEYNEVGETFAAGKFGYTWEEDDPRVEYILGGVYGLPLINYPDSCMYIKVA